MEIAFAGFYLILSMIVLFSAYNLIKFFFKNSSSYTYETDVRGNDKVITRKNTK